MAKRIPGLWRRGKVWWTKVYINGRPVRESTATEKETEAKRVLDKRRGAIANRDAQRCAAARGVL